MSITVGKKISEADFVKGVADGTIVVQTLDSRTGLMVGYVVDTPGGTPGGSSGNEGEAPNDQ